MNSFRIRKSNKVHNRSKSVSYTCNTLDSVEVLKIKYNVELKDRCEGSEVFLVYDSDVDAVTVFTSTCNFELSSSCLHKHIVFTNGKWIDYSESKTVSEFMLCDTLYENIHSYGYTVNASTNGEVIIVSCPTINNNKGCVFVYVKNKATYKFVQRLEGDSSSYNSRDGTVCVVSGNGNTIGFNSKINNEDVFVIFNRQNNYWTKKCALSRSALSASISQDGNTLALGCESSIDIVKYCNNTWCHKNSISENDKLLGRKVCISGDGLYVFSITEKGLLLCALVIDDNVFVKYVEYNRDIVIESIDTNYTGTIVALASHLGLFLATRTNDTFTVSTDVIADIISCTGVSMSSNGTLLCVADSNKCEAKFIATSKRSIDSCRVIQTISGSANFGHCIKLTDDGNNCIISSIGEKANVKVFSK